MSKRRLAHYSKSDSNHYNYFATAQETRLSVYVINYMELNPSLCEPPYTRPAWLVLNEVEGYGGV
ncbi:MAG: hypothetical protein ACRC6O_10460 [Flavobacterium sp.]